MADRKQTDRKEPQRTTEEVQPEFRENAGSGDLGAEETGPPSLAPESGTGSAHDYPGGAMEHEEEGESPGEEGTEEPIPDSRKRAEEQEQPAPERPPDESSRASPSKPEGERS